MGNRQNPQNKRDQKRRESRMKRAITLTTPDGGGLGNEVISMVQQAYAQAGEGFVWTLSGTPQELSFSITRVKTALPAHQAAWLDTLLGLMPADPKAALTMLEAPADQFADMARLMLTKEDGLAFQRQPLCCGWVGDDGSVYGWMVFPTRQTLCAPSEQVLSHWGVPS